MPLKNPLAAIDLDALADSAGALAVVLRDRALDGADAILFRGLRIWWYGHDPMAVAFVEPEPEVEEEADVADEPVDRLALSQKIWGPGFLVPGGVDYVMTMVKPFGVNPAMSLLDLTAGLGGPSRHISQFFDVYITAMERAPEIAKRAHAMSIDAGLAKKVPVVAYDPETVELKAHAFDCAYAEYLTCSIQAKERFIKEVNKALKARGQFGFVDFVLADGDGDDPRLEPLKRLERFTPQPWSVDQYTACLNSSGFDVRIAEDHSDAYVRHVSEGWAQFVENYDVKLMTRGNQAAIAEECELWMARLAAVESGALKVYRFYTVSTHGAIS